MKIFTGSQSLLVKDESKNISFPVLVMYPTQIPSRPVAFGPYSIGVSPDAKILEGSFPLVILSHGSGSTPLVYRTIATYLTQHGYIVAMPEHYGNNRHNNILDNTGEGKIENLQNRPRHIRLVIDAIFSNAQFKDPTQPENVAIIGHSMGGYTDLAVAGGQPWAGLEQKIEVTPDPRVKTIALMAPTTNWFVPNDSLKEVKIPILMLIAELDSVTYRWQAQLLLDGVPDLAQVTLKVIENAGHYSFLSPFPPSMKNTNFPPSVDPEGFDRENFHVQLNEELRIFLDKTLKGI